MGRETHNFRQSNSSRQGSQSAQNYAKINRVPWHSRIFNILKVRGKGENYGQS